MKQFKITIILFLFFAAGVQAQDFADSTIIVLQKEIKGLKSANKMLKNELESQKQQLQALFDSVRTELKELNVETLHATSLLEDKITETEKSATKQISSVTESVGKKTLFGIIGGAVLLVLSVGLFFWLYVKRKADSASIVKQLEDQKSSLETKLVKEYSSQADVLENLMKTIRELPVSTAPSGELDHSLALKLADEITLMERNISHMNSDTKGLKPLIRAIERLKDNLASNGYELPDLLGKPYNEGMKAQVITSIPDDNLEQGSAIITKVIKPQVNFKDKMVQMAQIEVSVG